MITPRFTPIVFIRRATYTPEGELFAESVTPIKRLWAGTIAAAVTFRVNQGWTQTAPNQVAKVDWLGYLDVVTFEEQSQ